MDCYCEDEDVTLPNSPLYHYLKELAKENASHENLCSEFMSDVKLSKPQMRQFSATDYLKSLLSALKNRALLFFKSLLPPGAQINERRLTRNIFKVLLSKNLLISEDKSFLQNFESGEVRTCDKKSYLFQWLKLPCFSILTMFMSSRLVCITDPVTTIFHDSLGFVLWNRMNWKIFGDIMSCFSLFSATFFIFQLLIFFYQHIRCSSILKKINELSYSLSNITLLLKKSNRLIQEAELIARGFTSASCTGIAGRLEMASGLPIISPNRQHPNFRKSIFSCNKNVFLLHRTATYNLIHAIPIKPELSFSSHCLATLDLAEFGDFFKFDVYSDSEFLELLKFSDNLSISALKMMYQLMELQISEFCKCLCLVSVSALRDASLSSLSFVLQTLNCILNHTNKEIKCLLEKMKITYTYYKSVEISHVSKGYTVPFERCNSSVLNIAIHNMSLHLKAALHRINEIEDYLGEDKSIDKNIESAHLVNGQLNEVKSEIIAYNDCFDDCNNELIRLLTKNKDKEIIDEPAAIDVNSLNCKQSSVSLPKKKILECNSDRIIEDEVFEALITESKYERNKVECVKFEMDNNPNINHEVTTHLMHELRNILVVKADEHRKREEKALASKKSQMSKIAIDSNVEVSSLEKLNSSLNVDSVENHDNEYAQLKNYPEENRLLFNTFKEAKCASLHDQNLNTTESPFCVESKVHLFKNMSSVNGTESFVSDNICDIAAKENCEGKHFDEQPVKFSVDHSNQAFAVSIAALAAQRQNRLGILSDTYFEDKSDSELELDN